MDLFLAIPIAPLVAGYLASFLCRMSLRRSIGPNWLIAPLGIGVGVSATWLVTFQEDLLQPSRWSSKADGPVMLVLTGLPAAFLAAAIAIPIVYAYHQKYVHSHPQP